MVLRETIQIVWQQITLSLIIYWIKGFIQKVTDEHKSRLFISNDIRSG